MTELIYPHIVAHRGAGKLAPENTLAALETGAALGHRMVEFDAKLSADNQVFLLHDDLVDRTSNGHGRAKNMTYSALAALDAGAWLDARFKGTHMPTLAQAAMRCQALSLAANVEIKPCEGRDLETGELVAAEVLRCWQNVKDATVAANPIDAATCAAPAISDLPPLLSSFSFDALSRSARVAQALPRGMLYETIPENWREHAQELGSFSLHAHYKQFNQGLVEEIKSTGLHILAYTVNDPDAARELLRWGVDMICTDRIDLIGPSFSLA